MALKDLKSDLSKFRRPIEKPLSEKKRVDIPKSTNQTPLSQLVDKSPSAPKSNTTAPKQGVTPSKFDNSSKHLGEVTPSKFDNSSNYLGEATPSKMSLEERFLGQTETQEVNQGDKFKGETETTNITQGDRFKGQTTPQDYSSEEKFKGETTTTEFRFTQQFLGETTPTEFSLTERFLGETTPNVFGFSEKFLGETTPTDFNSEEQFLGETTPVDFNLSEKFLGETTPNGFTFNPNFDNQAKDPKFVDFITNDDARGFSPFQQPKNNSTFAGVDPSQTQFEGVTPISGQFITNQYDVSLQSDNGLGKSYTNEVLKSTYNKFNLKKDSHNTSIFKQPFILSGIQRENGEPETLGVGSFSFIRGGAVTAAAKAVIDVVRMGQFLLTPRGITWQLKQVGLQRSQKYGTKYRPDNLLLNLGGQHLGIRVPRTNGTDDETFKYINRNDSDFLRTLALDSDLESFSTVRSNLNGGFDSFYGIGPTQETRVVNTFENIESEGKTAGFGNDIKDYEAISYGTIQKIQDKDASNYEGDFRNLKTSKFNIDSKTTAGENYETNNLEKTYGTPATFKTNAERIGPNNKSLRTDSVYDSVFNAELQKDLVHLFFAYDTTAGTQDDSKIIQFRSTISGVTETFSPSWNGIKYPGRADKAYMYSEFERTLSFNFKVYATSRDEMKTMWKKLSELSKLTMPTYGSAYSGHICYFRLGQLWGNAKQGVPSLITSLSYTIPDDLSWDINHDGNLAELPIGADVNIGLTLLPDTIYKSNKNHYSFYDTKAFQ